MGMMSEFKDFIAGGNAMDMAVGVILGGATAAIVGSLVNDILMPIIGMVSGGLDFTSLKAALGGADSEAFLTYGNFIQAVINLLIIGFVLFMIVRSINKMKAPEVEEEAAPDPQLVLLEEIRDNLKK